MYWQSVLAFLVRWRLIYCWKIHVVLEVGKQLCIKSFRITFGSIQCWAEIFFFCMIANFKCKHMFLTSWRIKYCSNFFPATQNIKICLPISCTHLSLQCQTAAPIGVVKCLRINAVFLTGNSASGVAISTKLFANYLYFCALNKWVYLTTESIPMPLSTPSSLFQSFPAGATWFCLLSLQCWGTTDRTLINVWLSSWFKHHLIGWESICWNPP